MARIHSHVHCRYTYPSGGHCSALVPLRNVLRFSRGGKLPLYCDDHEKRRLNTRKLTLRAGRKSVAVNYKSLLGPYATRAPPANPPSAFVPSSLWRHTQVALRHLMATPPSAWDKRGFIYALEVAGTSSPLLIINTTDMTSTDVKDRSLIRIKVGRTNDIQRRLREHRRNCPSLKHKLLGFYPSPKLGRATAGVPYYDRLERLVHTELTDLATSSYPAGQSSPRRRCTDCQYPVSFPDRFPPYIPAGGHVHTEIFTFTRLQGRDAGREWLTYIRPVLIRWGRFVSTLP